jgi:hypothetical protein
MAFDPDAYLASRTSSTFDPDKYLADKGESPDDAPTKAESFIRGGAQGLTLGHADEITGALESATSDKSYEQARDESRAKYDAAKKENPWSYGAGDVAGSIPAYTGATIVTGGNPIAGAALAGAVQGEGSSDAPLLSGDTAKRAAIGGTVGAAMGAVGEGVSRLLNPEGLTEVAENQAAKATGANTADFRNLGEDRVRAAGRAALDNDVITHTGSTEDMAEKVVGMNKQAGQKIGDVLKSVDGGVDPQQAIADLDKLGARLQPTDENMRLIERAKELIRRNAGIDDTPGRFYTQPGAAPEAAGASASRIPASRVGGSVPASRAVDPFTGAPTEPQAPSFGLPRDPYTIGGGIEGDGGIMPPQPGVTPPPALGAEGPGVVGTKPMSDNPMLGAMQPEKPIPFDKMNAIKSELQGQASWAEPAAHQETKRAIAGTVRNTLDTTLEGASPTAEDFKAFQDAKKLYGNSINLSDFLEKRAAREFGRSGLSVSDLGAMKLATGTTPAKMAGLGAWKMWRQYGNQNMALAADWLSKAGPDLLKQFGEFAPTLVKGGEDGASGARGDELRPFTTKPGVSGGHGGKRQ